MSWAQLRRRDVSKAAISRAVASERLFEIHRFVYSVVAPELLSIEGRLAAAILAGGRGACLCGLTAAWWLGLSSSMPQLIHIGVRGPREPANGIQWHRLDLRPDEKGKYNRMPITSPARTALDVASDLSLWELKGVLAELEYHFDIEAEQLRPMLRRGYPGSKKLRQAIAEHTPQLAETASRLEDAFARFLVERRFELPTFNRRAGASTVDAALKNVIVELDGVRGHKGERRILRDHRRDLHRRADGKLVLRYHYAQLIDPKDQLLIEEELDRVGIPRRAAARTPAARPASFRPGPHR